MQTLHIKRSVTSLHLEYGDCSHLLPPTKLLFPTYHTIISYHPSYYIICTPTCIYKTNNNVIIKKHKTKNNCVVPAEQYIYITKLNKLVLLDTLTFRVVNIKPAKIDMNIGVYDKNLYFISGKLDTVVMYDTSSNNVTEIQGVDVVIEQIIRVDEGYVFYISTDKEVYYIEDGGVKKLNGFGVDVIMKFDKMKQVGMKQVFLDQLLKNEIRGFLENKEGQGKVFLSFFEKLFDDFPLFKKSKLKKKNWFQKWILREEDEAIVDEKKVDERKGKEKMKKIVKKEKIKETKNEKKGSFWSSLFGRKKRDEDEEVFLSVGNDAEDLDDEEVFLSLEEDDGISDDVKKEGELKDDNKEKMRESIDDEIIIQQRNGERSTSTTSSWYSLEDWLPSFDKLSTWWNSNFSKPKDMVEESVGSLVYFIPEFFQLFRLAFKTTEKDYNYIEYLSSTINFFVVSTSDDSLKDILYSDKYFDTSSESFKENINLLTAIYNLDSPIVIYNTIRDCKDYSELPDRYKKCLYKISEEIISTFLVSYCDYDSISVDNIEHFKFIKKTLKIIKPIFVYSNPIPMVHYLVNLILFSRIGKELIKSSMNIEYYEKECEKIYEKIENEKVKREFDRMFQLSNIERLHLIEKMIINDSKDDDNLYVTVSLNKFYDNFFKARFPSIKFDKSEIRIYLDYFLNRLILLEKQSFLDMIMNNKETQRKIIRIFDIIIPVIKIIYDTLEIELMFKLWIDTITSLVKVFEQYKNDKSTQHLSKEERKKIWEIEKKNIFSNFSRILFLDLNRLLINDENNEKLFITTINWIIKVREKLNYISMSKCYFKSGGDKNVEKQKELFLDEVKSYLNNLL